MGDSNLLSEKYPIWNLRLARSGNILLAIHLYRGKYNTSPAEGKAGVERLLNMPN
jgi:hypothetical protein